MFAFWHNSIYLIITCIFMQPHFNMKALYETALSMSRGFKGMKKDTCLSINNMPILYSSAELCMYRYYLCKPNTVQRCEGT